MTAPEPSCSRPGTAMRTQAALASRCVCSVRTAALASGGIVASSVPRTRVTILEYSIPHSSRLHRSDRDPILEAAAERLEFGDLKVGHAVEDLDQRPRARAWCGDDVGDLVAIDVPGRNSDAAEESRIGV